MHFSITSGCEKWRKVREYQWAQGRGQVQGTGHIQDTRSEMCTVGGWRWGRKTRRQRETQRLEDDRQGREDGVWWATGSQHVALQRGERGGRGRGDCVHPAPPGSWPRGAPPRSASRGSCLPGCGCAGRCSLFTEQKKHK